MARGGGARPQGRGCDHAMRNGQALRHRCRVRGRQSGSATAWWLRLPQRIRHRKNRARSARASDSRRHQRNHAPDRGAQADRGRAMTAQAAAVAGSEPDLIARREGAVGVIRLNRPKTINAVTLQMFRAVDKALDTFEADPQVGLILLEGPDEIYAAFEDAVVPSRKLAALREALVNLGTGVSSADVKAEIDHFATGETAGPVAAIQSQIDRWFAHDRMQDIVAALRRDGSELTQSTLKPLNEKSPRGMVVALKLLRLARASSSLERCLSRE